MEAKQKNKKTETVSNNAASNNHIPSIPASSLPGSTQPEQLLNSVMTAFQQQGKSTENISMDQMKSMMEEVLKKVLTGQENGSTNPNADEKFNLVEKRKRKERAGKPGGPQEQYIFHLKLEENKKKKKKSKKEPSPSSATSTNSTPSSHSSTSTKRKPDEITELDSNNLASFTNGTPYLSNSHLQNTPSVSQSQSILQTPTSATSSFSSISASNLPPSLLQYDIQQQSSSVNNNFDTISLNNTVNLEQLDEVALQKILIAKQQQSKRLQQQQQQQQQTQQLHVQQQQQPLLDVMQPTSMSHQGSRRNSLVSQQTAASKKPSIISIILPAVLKAATPTIVSLMDGCILKVNENLCKLLGYPQHILESTLIQNIIHPEDRANHHLILLQMLSANSDTCKHDIRMINFSGRVVRIYQEVCCVRNEMAVPQWVITKIVDVQYLEETVARDAFTLLHCSHGHAYIKDALLTHDSPMEFSDIFVNILEHLFGNLQPACFYDDQTSILWNNDSFDALFGVHGKPFKGKRVLDLNEMKGSAMEILTRGVLKELPEKLEAQSSATPVPALRKIITVKCYGQKISRPDGSLFGYLWLFTETYQDLLSEDITKQYLRTSSPLLPNYEDDFFKLTPSNSTDNLFGFSNFAYEGNMPMLNSNVIQNQLQRSDTPSREVQRDHPNELSQGEFPFFV